MECAAALLAEGAPTTHAQRFFELAIKNGHAPIVSLMAESHRNLKPALNFNRLRSLAAASRDKEVALLVEALAERNALSSCAAKAFTQEGPNSLRL